MGDNIWVLPETYGCVVQFEPYQGAKKVKQVASSTKRGLGENVVLRLIVVYNLARFAPWDIFGLRGISTFWHKKS